MDNFHMCNERLHFIIAVGQWFRKKVRKVGSTKHCLKKIMTGAVGVFFILVTFGDVYAQEIAPGTIIVPTAYGFAMQLPPGTDVTIRIKPRKEKDSDGKEASNTPQSNISEDDIVIERSIRDNVVRESKSVGKKEPASVRYYIGEWCAFDDQRKGVNIYRSGIDHEGYPPGLYQFPELTWAGPNTRKQDPVVKEGASKIELYRDGGDVLEIDALTKRPLRYIEGSREWIYSYRNNLAPVILSEKLTLALQEVLSKQKK